jgi:inhibitor of cysteine peptidase
MMRSGLMRQLFILVICYFSMLQYSYAYSSSDTYDENSTNIVVTSGQPTFVIKLKSNPTTGYSWQLAKLDKNLIESVKHEYVAPQSGLIGAGGFEYWTFRAKSAAFVESVQSVIAFEYVRPWEAKNAAATAKFMVKTDVE